MDTTQILLKEIKELKSRLDKLENRDHGNPLSSLSVIGDGSIGGTLLVTGEIGVDGDAAGLSRRIHNSLSVGTSYLIKFNADPSWTWAGSPFTTLYSEQYVGSHLWGTMSTTSSAPGPRSFLYQSSHMPAGSLFGSFSLNAGGTNTGVGIRMDSGSDTNFVEVLLCYTGTAMQYKIRRRYQIAGGGITANDGAYNLVYPNAAIQAYISGTRWSNWNFEPIIYLPGQMYGASRCGITVSGLAWTPTRVGIVFNKADSDASSWYTGYCDWFYYP